MFTGLIEEVGTVAAVQQTGGGSRLTIRAEKVLDKVALGDSIAIDGACTTVIAFDKTTFTIEASPETLDKTTFKNFKAGTPVNLERPLTPSSRIGGHYVTGHVDGLARIVSIEPQGISFIFMFEVEQPELAQYLVPKGSVAVSGISLTVNTVDANRFSVAIIPHTMAHTTLGHVKAGDSVNIETDLLGKYVKKFLSPVFNSVSRVDESFLQQHGFMPASAQGG